jgi:cell division protein FtsB
MERRRQVVWGAVAVALVLVVGSLAGEGGFRRYSRLQADVAALEEKNARIAAENARLQREIKQLRSNPAAIERAAREQLGLVRPGEVVFNLEAP